MAKGAWIAVGIIVVLIIAGVAFYGTSVKKEALQSCEMGVADVRIGNMGLNSADITIVFEIRNLGDTTATMDKIDYKVYRNDTYLGSGEVTKKIEIPPYETKMADTSFTFKYADVGEAIRSALEEGTVTWRISGKTYLHTTAGKIEVPFEITSKG